VGPGWQAFTLSLVGLKPILEARNEIVNAPRPPTQTMPHTVAASLTRATEVAAESLPLGLYQLCVALSMEELHWTQIVSLAFSVVATAFIGAQTNRLLDTNASLRISDPIFYGFYPRVGTRASLVELGDTLLCGGYCASKFIALAVLTLAAPTVAGGWLSVECCLLLLWRVCDDEWRNANPGTDGVFASLFSHVVEYLAGLAYPMHLARVPGYLFGPRRYAFFTGGNLLVSNPLQLVLGLWLHVHRPAHVLAPVRMLAPEQLCMAFGTTTLTAIFGGVLLLTFMDPEYRQTFYLHLPARKHVRDFHWHTRTTARRGDGQDAARAETVVMYSHHYLPHAEVTAWLAENWSAWEAAPPEWFTDYWKKRVQRQCPHLLPAEVLLSVDKSRISLTQVVQSLQGARHTQVTSEELDVFASQIERAASAGVSDAAVQPARALLSRVRLQLPEQQLPQVADTQSNKADPAPSLLQHAPS
jgi:fumarate reductase subunit D